MIDFNKKILACQGGGVRALIPLLGYLSEFEKHRYRPFNTFICSSIASYAIAAYLSGSIRHKAPGIIARVHEYSNNSPYNDLKALGSIFFGDGTQFDPIFDLDRIINESFDQEIIDFKALLRLKVKFYLTLMEYETGDGIFVNVGDFAKEHGERETRKLFKAALGYPIISGKKSFDVFGKQYLDGGMVYPIPYFPKKLKQTLSFLIDQRTDNRIFEFFTDIISKRSYGEGVIYQRISNVNRIRDNDFDMLHRMADHGLTYVISGGKDVTTPFIGTDSRIMFLDYYLSRGKALKYLKGL